MEVAVHGRVVGSNTACSCTMGRPFPAPHSALSGTCSQALVAKLPSNKGWASEAGEGPPKKSPGSWWERQVCVLGGGVAASSRQMERLWPDLRC